MKPQPLSTPPSTSAQRVAGERAPDARGLAVKALQQRASELGDSIKFAEKELSRWRKENGGLMSMRRVGSGLQQLSENLQAGKGAFWEGAGEKITDAETLERAPQRKRILDLRIQLAQVQAAAAQLQAGKAISIPHPRDYSLAEAAALAEGKPLSAAQSMQHRLTFLAAAASEGDVDAALEAYDIALEPYHDAPSADGESVKWLKSGQLSVTGLINQLSLIDVVHSEDAKLIATADDLRASLPAVREARARGETGKNAKLRQVCNGLSDEALQKELSRLERLEKGEPQSGLRKELAPIHAQLDVLKRKNEKGLLERAGAGIAHFMDDPSVWAMALVGGLSARATGSLLSQAGRAVPLAAEAARISPELASLAKLRAAAVPGRAVALQAAVHGATFHTGMNAFEIARGKSEHASWQPGDFLRSMVMFEALAGVRYVNALKPPPTSTFWKGVNATKLFGQELGVFAGLGIGESYLRTGSMEGAGATIEDNINFLVALRMMGAARSVFRGDAIGHKLGMQEARVRAAMDGAEKVRTPEAAARANAEYQAFWKMAKDAGLDVSHVPPPGGAPSAL